MRRMRILIVEDDATIGSLLAEMLEDTGFTVCAVEFDVARVVEAAERFRPALMIVDIGLAGAFGVAAVEEILRDGITPCVFASDVNLREPSFAPGAVFIRKPFRGPEIVAAIRRATSGSSRRVLGGGNSNRELGDDLLAAER